MVRLERHANLPRYRQRPLFLPVRCMQSQSISRTRENWFGSGSTTSLLAETGGLDAAHSYIWGDGQWQLSVAGHCQSDLDTASDRETARINIICCDIDGFTPPNGHSGPQGYEIPAHRNTKHPCFRTCPAAAHRGRPMSAAFDCPRLVSGGRRRTDKSRHRGKTCAFRRSLLGAVRRRSAQ